MNVANLIFTILLTLAAITAAYFTWHNLKILRGQFRDNTFQILLKELAEPSARENRQLIFQHLSPSQQLTDTKTRILRGTSSYERHRGAIEETVSCLDRLGFFLLKGDPKLKDEAPEFIWEITSQMWTRTEWYVSHRRQSSKQYGQYFEGLNKEAEERGYIENVEELKESKEGN